MGACCSKGKDFGGGLQCKEEEEEEEVVEIQGVLERLKFHDSLEGEEDENGTRVGEGGGRVRLKGSSSLASMFSKQGWKGVNQDAMTIWEDFGGATDRIFCGVFDGHGPLGHKVSCHVRDNLPSKLSLGLKSLGPIDCDHFRSGTDEKSANCDEWRSLKDAFVGAFEELDKELSTHSVIDCICSGSTAVSIVKQGEHLIVANLGDSRAVLCTRDDKNQVAPIQLTVDLKPNIPNEAERIRNCKGRVFALIEEPDVHRLWLPDEDSPGLAMARAFGDFCLKDFGLISTPDVSYRKLTEMDEFVVLATDGIWDVLSNEEVIKIVMSATKRSEAAKQVVERAVKGWRSKHPTSKVDDCTVICLFLKPPVQSPKSSSFRAHRPSGKSRELSFSDSFKTAVSEEVFSESEDMGHSSKDDWTALEGVSRVNSLMKIPRFNSVLSWRKRSAVVEEEGS